MTVEEMDILNTISSPQQKQHWLVEQILSWSGLPVVEVRPTLSMGGLLPQNATSIAASNEILAPFRAGTNSVTAAFDVARAIAASAADPLPHIGRTYYLNGPLP
jgi:uncharacterized protein YbjT (DUF2867 family)